MISINEKGGIFGAIGRFIIRYYKLVISLWLILCILMVPFALRLEKALTYSDEAFIPENLESYIVEKIIDKKFKNFNDTDVIIVVKSPNIKSDIIRKYIDRLKQEILSSNKVIKIKNIKTINDVYNQVIHEYHKLMNEIKEKMRDNFYKMINNATLLILNFKSNITKLRNFLLSIRQNTNFTLTLIYGLPDIYGKYWLNSVYNSDPNTYISVINIEVEDQVLRMVKEHVNSTTYTLIKNYLDSFRLKWEKTFPGSLTVDEIIKMLKNEKLRIPDVIQETINDVFPEFFGKLKDAGFISKDIYDFISTVKETFNIYTWNNSSLINRFVVDYSHEILYKKGISIDKEILYRILSKEEDKAIILSLARDYIKKAIGKYQYPIDVFKYIENHLNEIYDAAIGKLDKNYVTNSLTNEVFYEIVKLYPRPAYPEGIPHSILRFFMGDEILLTYVSFTADCDNREAINNVNAIRELARNLKEDMRLTDVNVYVTGSSAISADIEDSFRNDISNIDKVTIILVLVILSIIFLSLVTPIMPLLMVGISIVVAQAILYFWATYIFDIHYLVRGMLTAVMMGAGVDYSIYLVYRFLEERSKGATLPESVLTSVRYAGEAIVSSGGTVMVGFGSLMLTDFKMLQSIGFSLLLAIAVTILVALTLIPSLLMLLGDRFFWPRKLTRREVRSPLLRKITKNSIKYSRLVLMILLIITLPLVYSTVTLTRSYDTLQMLPEIESKHAYNIIANELSKAIYSEFSLIIISPNNVVLPNGSINVVAFNNFERIIKAVEDVKGVDNDFILGFTRPNGSRIPVKMLEAQMFKGASIYLGDDNKTVLYIVGLKYEPTSDMAFKTIREVRKKLSNFINSDVSLSEYKIYVGGGSALLLDIRSLVDLDFIRYMIPAVIIGIYLILLFLLGSVFLPLRLILTILMSIAWTLGLVNIIANDLLNIKVYWIAPIMLFSLLMGLGMDYDIFLVTRIREEVERGASDDYAIIKAVETTGTVITICGTIMAVALGSLLFSSLLFLQEIGGTLALAILLDAFIVRIILVPSIMSIMKKWNWWAPKPIQRVKKYRN